MPNNWKWEGEMELPGVVMALILTATAFFMAGTVAFVAATGWLLNHS